MSGNALRTTDRLPSQRPGALMDEVRATIVLALPLALTQIGQLAMFTTDLALIGRLGAEYLAAGALAHTILFTAFIPGMGLMSAVAPLTAQAVGANTPQMVRRSLRVGLHAALALALPMIALQVYSRPLLTLLGQDPQVSDLAVTYLHSLAWSVLPAWGFMAVRGYMSALGAPNPGLWIMLAGIPANAALAYALIYGWGPFPALGLIGAGIATSLVNAAMLTAALWVIANAAPYRAYAPLANFCRPDWEHFRKLLWIGVPVAVAFTLEHGLFAASTLMAGAISTTALAAHQIAFQVAAIVFMLPLGISMAASVRVGTPFGALDMDLARQAGFVAIGLGALVCLVTMVTTIVAAGLIPALFLGARTPETAVTYDLAAILVVYGAAFFVVDGMQTIANGALRGLSDTRIPMVFSAISFWLVGFPVAWALAFWVDFGVRGVWLGLCAGLACYALLLVARFHLKARSG